MKIRLVVIILAVLSIALPSCFNANIKNTPINNTEKEIGNANDTSPEFNVQFDHHSGWTYNQNMYEVNIRQYTPEGTFNAFANELPRLKEMGVGILWLMPINPIGVVNHLGSLGSYYSVKDYKNVNAEFGTMDDFKDLVKKTHAAGLHLIVDWVPNHTAWDNSLTLTNPEYYLLTDSGDFQGPPGMGWSDVIQLDYSNENLQTYMIETLKEWVIQTGIDGFRFDYVDGVPEAFWKKATQELKALKPDIFLLAEGEGTKYHDMGFDMDYGWLLYGWGTGLSKGIYEGTKTLADMDAFMKAEKSKYMPDKYHMYFTSTHDENSWQGTEFEQLGESSEVFAVLSQTFYGMPLIYSGQESAMNKRLEFFDKDDITWGNYKYKNFYTTFNNLRDTNCALWNGVNGAIPVRIKTNNDASIFAYSRKNGGSEVVVFLNLTKAAIKFKISDAIYAKEYTDIFADKKINISKEKSIPLGAWGYLVLVK